MAAMTPEDIERMAREAAKTIGENGADFIDETGAWEYIAAALRRAYNAGVEDVALSFDKSWPRCARWSRALKLPE